MESLTEHLDALQDQILSLIEADSTKLSDQIKYWGKVRQEAVLYYGARKAGHKRIGFQPVPTLCASEAAAKGAIKMQLMLQSLMGSDYAQESWTMTQTSQEVLNADPKDCFKKDGETVEVVYDGVTENAVAHTMWNKIYVQNKDNKWCKVTGHVDHKGLWYQDPDYGPYYYTRFDADVSRYSSTGTWYVKTKSQTIFAPLDSPAQATDGPRPWDRQHPTASPGFVCSPTIVPCEETSWSWWGTPSDPTTGSVASGSCVSRTATGQPSPVTQSPQTPLPRRRGGFRGRRVGRRPSGQRELPTIHRRPCEEVGSRPAGATTGHRQRLSEVERSAGHRPVLVVTGQTNPLRCWRYRLKHKSRHLYCDITSAFAWLSEGGRGNQSSLLVSFSGECQREKFLATVGTPKGTHCSTGYLLL